MTCNAGHPARRLAVDPADHRLRLPDRDAGLRPALDARLLPDADVERQWLGPRRVRARDRASRCCSGARRSLSSARSPTASVRCWCCASARVLYAIGFTWMVFATTPGAMYLSAGVLIGFGLAGASFTVVIGAFGKLLPPEWRTFSFGLGTAAGSFGQFLFSPLAIALNSAFDWHTTLLIFAGVILLILPLSLALAVPKNVETPAQRAAQQSVGAALRRGARASEFRAARARLFHLRLSGLLRHRASAGLSRRSRPVGRSRRLRDRRRSDCSTSSARSAPAISRT